MRKLRAKHRNARPEDFDIHGDIRKIKADLASFASDVKGKAGAVMSRSLRRAKDRSEKAKQRVSKLVIKKPMKTLSVAMLTGAVLGYFLNR